MRVPEEAGLGDATIHLSFPAWKEGKVASVELKLPVVNEKPRPKAAPEKKEARPKAPGAAKSQAINSLRQIGIACHAYMDVHSHLPAAAITSKEGKALLSWRVALLPYLDQEALHRQFKLDEPWDSPHNLKMLHKMPAVFAASSDSGNKTPYRVFTGPDTLFDGMKGARPADVRDGFSNTFLVVEAKESVPWTKPDELSYDKKKPLPALGGSEKDVIFVLWADGSVSRMPLRYNEEVFRALITPRGNEVVGREEFTPKK